MVGQPFQGRPQVVEPIKTSGEMKVEKQFIQVISLIQKARYNASKAINTELINLYWEMVDILQNVLKVKVGGSQL